MEQMVFLQPHNGHFIPHTLHCLEVYPGIVLVLITEVHTAMNTISTSYFHLLHFLSSHSSFFFSHSPSFTINPLPLYDILLPSLLPLLFFFHLFSCPPLTFTLHTFVAKWWSACRNNMPNTPELEQCVQQFQKFNDWQPEYI